MPNTSLILKPLPSPSEPKRGQITRSVKRLGEKDVPEGGFLSKCASPAKGNSLPRIKGNPLIAKEEFLNIFAILIIVYLGSLIC